ncbi:Retrovirus-related Pol polyprotein from transposon TNT 1-94 [Vitis vinifera]|uniref:Retrovirus-related Pol polyprotein from transposon TNT 1-94 n=1 Tax=Vitis vinifera TaxID=29760 RepID=A0A438FLW5_VITVI|nr:Retrovirus-related Pol polyprotein from transposon TNT 1-94 [Vitis vinifera]
MMSLKYQDGTPMTDHLNTFQGIINQLVGMNIKFEEEVQGFVASWYIAGLVGDETSWVIDSGASIHATPRKDFFTSYTSGDFGSVRMGNDGSAKAIGKLDDEGFFNTSVIARVIDSSINAVDDDSTFELWHNRLGHMSEKGLMILAKKNLLSGMKKGSLKRCAHCLAGKQTRVAFKHFAIQGSQQFHALVERQSGEKLKCIRTDNGGEYSGPFDEYCRQHGIRHQKTPPKTPQLNGLAERMNRTLVERVRCLLSQSTVAKIFLGIWSNNEISYDHLRVFGCKAFVHIPKDERSKLDAKTRPCVFIGYGQDELGYRLKMKHMMTNMTWVDVETPTQVEDEAHDDQHDMGDVETPTQVEVDDDVHEQSPAAEAPSDIPLRRSTRDRHPSTRYSVDDYVLLTDGGEPESYVEAMEDENKMKWVDAMQDEMESLA